METRTRTKLIVQKEWQNTQSTDDEINEVLLPAKNPQKNLNAAKWEITRKKAKKATVAGVLGLASLVSGRDQDTPIGWVQQYSILTKDTNVLPTGLALAAVKLLKDSYEAYYGVTN